MTSLNDKEVKQIITESYWRGILAGATIVMLFVGIHTLIMSL